MDQAVDKVVLANQGGHSQAPAHWLPPSELTSFLLVNVSCAVFTLLSMSSPNSFCMTPVKDFKAALANLFNSPGANMLFNSSGFTRSWLSRMAHLLRQFS